MGTARQDIYDELKNNLHQDDAVIGEAAGIAMGLVMLGMYIYCYSNIISWKILGARLQLKYVFRYKIITRIIRHVGSKFI